MKAGETQLDVGTIARIVSISSDEPMESIGVVDSVVELTHPFGDSPGSILGAWVRVRGPIPPGVSFPDNRIALLSGDKLTLEDGRVVTL